MRQRNVGATASVLRLGVPVDCPAVTEALLARCHLGLARLHQAEGRKDEAEGARRQASEMFRSMGSDFWLAQAEGRNERV